MSLAVSSIYVRSRLQLQRGNCLDVKRFALPTRLDEASVPVPITVYACDSLGGFEYTASYNQKFWRKMEPSELVEHRPSPQGKTLVAVGPNYQLEGAFRYPSLRSLNAHLSIAYGNLDNRKSTTKGVGAALFYAFLKDLFFSPVRYNTPLSEDSLIYFLQDVSGKDFLGGDNLYAKMGMEQSRNGELCYRVGPALNFMVTFAERYAIIKDPRQE